MLNMGRSWISGALDGDKMGNIYKSIVKTTESSGLSDMNGVGVSKFVDC